VTMRPARIVCVLALGAGLAAGVGCGSDNGTIPSGQAQQLRDRLDGVRAAIDAGKCDDAAREVAAVRSEVDTLDVPAALRRNFREGLRKLDGATTRDCETAQPNTTTTPPTTVTETIPTQETATTEPPATTPTTTTPTTTQPPPETATTEPPTGGVPPGEEQGDGDLQK
jgi:cell division septation protein DedD